MNIFPFPGHDPAYAKPINVGDIFFEKSSSILPNEHDKFYLVIGKVKVLHDPLVWSSTEKYTFYLLTSNFDISMYNLTEYQFMIIFSHNRYE